MSGEKISVALSLRRHYPDQVQRVDGDESHPLSRVFPSSPLGWRALDDYLSAGRHENLLLFCFFEEVTGPLGPS
jgi:hypothetical protein